MCSLALLPCPAAAEAPPHPEAAPPAAEAPPAARPLAHLEQEICELAAHLAAATCRWLLLVGEFDERAGWAEWGVVSCAHWLSWRCSIGLVAARQHVRVARRLRQLPLVTKRFASGELSYSKVRAITRIATPETEGDLVELALHATGAQTEKLVRAYGGAAAATLESANATHEQRLLRWYWDDDGCLRVEAKLPAADGALLLAALSAAETEPGDDSAESSPPAQRTTASARRADALVTLARAGLDSSSAPRSGGDPCEVVVHVDANTLADDHGAPPAELANGPALAPETTRRLACDAAVVRIIERDGRPLSVGRRTRAIPPALRRALRARDDGCQFPGCTHRRFLHAHHIHHWARGGPTSLDNLVQLCSHHHRLVHEGGYRVRRAGPGRQLRFQRPDGRPIPTLPPPKPAIGPPLERRNRLVGLRVDQSTCFPRSAGDSLDYGIAVEGLLCSNHQGPPVFATVDGGSEQRSGRAP